MEFVDATVTSFLDWFDATAAGQLEGVLFVDGLQVFRATRIIVDADIWVLVENLDSEEEGKDAVETRNDDGA